MPMEYQNLDLYITEEQEDAEQPYAKYRKWHIARETQFNTAKGKDDDG